MTDRQFDLATRAVDVAVGRGASYADARVVRARRDRLQVVDGDVRDSADEDDIGISVRALVGSSWGFHARAGASDHDAEAAGRSAYETAAAGTLLAGPSWTLLPVDVHRASWSGPRVVDPWSVSATEKADLLVHVTAVMAEHGADRAEASYTGEATDRWLVSSEGHRIYQSVTVTGADLAAIATGADQTQRRSYPGSLSGYAAAGWEHVRGLDLPGNAARVAEEACALLRAPQCPGDVCDVILGGDQLATQVHETVAHAIELDRILGWEAGLAGTSWLDLPGLGSTRFGSDLMTIVIDPTLPGAAGGYRYDDEGTPAVPRLAVADGTWVGVLASRDNAAIAGVDHAGSVRGHSWQGLPMVRISSVGLAPGPHDVDSIVEATRNGILMETNRSWSVDDRRLNFQFGCEAAWEVKNGRRGRMLRNPTYGGIGPRFWQSMDMLSSETELVGMAGCGKGQPPQSAFVSHQVAPARFRDVEVGARR